MLARVYEINPDAEPSLFPGADEAMAAVRAGKVAITLQGELRARRFLAANPAARITLRLCEIGKGKDRIAIAVPPGRFDLAHWVNVFLDDREVMYDAAELIAHHGPWKFY